MNKNLFSLFSKYSDEDSFMDRKTLESIPLFANMLVSVCVGCGALRTLKHLGEGGGVGE